MAEVRPTRPTSCNLPTQHWLHHEKHHTGFVVLATPCGAPHNSIVEILGFVVKHDLGPNDWSLQLRLYIYIYMTLGFFEVYLTINPWMALCSQSFQLVPINHKQSHKFSPGCSHGTSPCPCSNHFVGPKANPLFEVKRQKLCPRVSCQPPFAVRKVTILTVLDAKHLSDRAQHGQIKRIPHLLQSKS